MKVKKYKSGKIIILSKPFDNRAKILNTVYFGSFSFAGFIFIYGPLNEAGFDHVGVYIFIAIASGAYLLAAYRFINKALQAEKLMVDKNTITILRGGLFSTKNNSYNISQISNFRYLDKPELTKHPLAGQSFDYLGFQTEQQVINEMHGDNKIAFDYDHKTITFGENVYSWDFEQIELLIHEITGKDWKLSAENKSM